MHYQHIPLPFLGFLQVNLLKWMLQKMRNVWWVEPLINLYSYLMYGAKIKAQ